MTGFYSKDIILESSLGQFFFSSSVIYIIAIIAAMFTTLYSTKVLYLTFITNPNGPIINYIKAHESNIFMSLPLIILAVLSVLFGYISKDVFIGLGSNFFTDNSIFIHPLHEIMLNTEFAISNTVKILPLVTTVFLIAVFLSVAEFLPETTVSFKFSRLTYNTFGFLNQRFLIELFYNKYIIEVIFELGSQTTKIIDKGSVELIGPFGLEKILIILSSNINKLNTTVVTSYALYTLIGFIFYVTLPVFLVNDSHSTLIITLMAFLAIVAKNYKSDKIINITQSI